MAERDVAAAVARARKATGPLGLVWVRSEDRDAVCDALEQAQRSLAECYRLSGADPDGNEDWRLACDAIAEVRRLRREYDEMQAKAEREWCRAENADAKGTLCEEAQLAAETKLAEAQQEIERLRERCDVLEPGARNYNPQRIRAEKAEALAAELARALSKYGEHAKDCAAWCNEDDPEYTSFWMSIYGGAAFFHPERACTCWRSTLLADPRVQALLKETL